MVAEASEHTWVVVVALSANNDEVKQWFSTFFTVGPLNCLLPPLLKVKVIMLPPLSVCLCTGYLKKLWTDPDEILWTGWVCNKEELIRFW